MGNGSPRATPAAGLILAGGRGRRLGGRKAELPFGAETLLLRALRIAREAGLRPLVVVAAADQEIGGLPEDVEVVHDALPDQGPLQAVADGLAHVAGRSDVAFVLACDLPLLTAAVVRAVVRALGRARGAVPTDADGRAHPLAAAYRVDLEPSVRERLREGERAARALLSIEQVRALSPETLRHVDRDLRCLSNVNTPEDLARALSLAEC